MAFKFINEKDKKEIAESFSELKKEWNKMKDELGFTGNNTMSVNKDENENKNDSQLKSKIEKRRESLKENIGLINSCLFLGVVLIIVLAINLFVNSMPFLGIATLVLIPLLICIEIYVCLKYTDMTLKEHYKLAEKKYGKDKIEVFIAISFSVIMILVMIPVFIIALKK